MLYLKNELLDVDRSDPIKLESNISLFQIGVIEGSYSLPFKLPETEKNKRLLGNIGHQQISMKSVTVDNITLRISGETLHGQLVISRYVPGIGWESSFIFEASCLYRKMFGKKLRELPFQLIHFTGNPSDVAHLMGTINSAFWPSSTIAFYGITNPQFAGDSTDFYSDGQVYPMINGLFAGTDIRNDALSKAFSPAPTDEFWKAESIHVPAIYVAEILQQIANSIGVKCVGSFFKDPELTTLTLNPMVAINSVEKVEEWIEPDNSTTFQKITIVNEETDNAGEYQTWGYLSPVPFAWPLIKVGTVIRAPQLTNLDLVVAQISETNPRKVRFEQYISNPSWNSPNSSLERDFHVKRINCIAKVVEEVNPAYLLPDWSVGQFLSNLQTAIGLDFSYSPNTNTIEFNVASEILSRKNSSAIALPSKMPVEFSPGMLFKWKKVENERYLDEALFFNGISLGDGSNMIESEFSVFTNAWAPYTTAQMTVKFGVDEPVSSSPVTWYSDAVKSAPSSPMRLMFYRGMEATLNFTPIYLASSLPFGRMGEPYKYGLHLQRSIQSSPYFQTSWFEVMLQKRFEMMLFHKHKISLPLTYQLLQAALRRNPITNGISRYFIGKIDFEAPANDAIEIELYKA